MRTVQIPTIFIEIFVRDEYLKKNPLGIRIVAAGIDAQLHGVEVESEIKIALLGTVSAGKQEGISALFVFFFGDFTLLAQSLVLQAAKSGIVGQILDGVISIFDIARIKPDFLLKDGCDRRDRHALTFHGECASSGVTESSHKIIEGLCVC